MRTRAPLAVLACVALAGCGSQESGFTRVGDEEVTMRPDRLRSEATIDMKGISFSPATVRVRAGGQVTWRNRDRVAHTVTQGTELYHRFTSGAVEPGETYAKTFHTAQRIGYRCTIHPNMQGTLLVEGD